MLAILENLIFVGQVIFVNEKGLQTTNWYIHYQTHYIFKEKKEEDKIIPLNENLILKWM